MQNNVTVGLTFSETQNTKYKKTS